MSCGDHGNLTTLPKMDVKSALTTHRMIENQAKLILELEVRLQSWLRRTHAE